MEADRKRKTFIQETIPDTDLMQEDLSGSRLIGSTIQSFKLREGRCRYLRVQNSLLQNISIDHVLCYIGYYQDCHWTNLQIRDSFLTESHFSRCKFEMTVGELSSFGLSTFNDCKLQGSRFSEISFSGSWWHACRFEQEDYFFVRFPSSVFIDTQFVGCRLQKAIFRAATFIRCCFESCTLDDAVFNKARLIDTKWIDTDINQAANLEEIRYD